MKRFALVASPGVALAVVVATQALRAPERGPVTPIKLPNPVTRSEDEPAKAPAGRTTARDRTAGRPVWAGRPVTTRPGEPPPQSPPVRGPADNAGTNERDPTPPKPAPTPAPGGDEPDDDSDTDDDAGDDDDGGD